MTLCDQLLKTADMFCAATGMSRARVSTIVLSGGLRIDHIEAGGDIRTKSFERAMQWFSDNWPDEAGWPDGVARPAKTPKLEAAE